MHTHTVLTAADVRRLARHGTAAGLNRQITPQTVRNLDPDGLSIMTIAIPFHNIDRNGVTHHRVDAFLKMRGTSEPAQVQMDVLTDDWDKLPEAKEPEGTVTYLTKDGVTEI